jgi:hypothetical protein
MRQISISTDVFARIWACRKHGEETENAILDRIIPGKQIEDEGSELDSLPPPHTAGTGGHTERRYGVHFPGGFEISRVYLGKEYGANAVSSGWVLANDGKTYGSLNELSHAIGTKTENVWRNWFYFENGKRKPISEMRDQALITRRSRQAVDAGKLLAELEETKP